MMKISAVLKMDGGSVVCVENKATITITKTDNGNTYSSTFPEGSPVMDAKRFEELYRSKHFEASKPATKGKS